MKCRFRISKNSMMILQFYLNYQGSILKESMPSQIALTKFQHGGLCFCQMGIYIQSHLIKIKLILKNIYCKQTLLLQIWCLLPAQFNIQQQQKNKSLCCCHSGLSSPQPNDGYFQTTFTAEYNVLYCHMSSPFPSPFNTVSTFGMSPNPSV